MKKPIGIFVSVAVWSLGCEQLIGLDGPYKAASGGAGAECTDGATEECYSGDLALKGIGACQSGTRTCVEGAWGPCAGDGVPSIEQCTGNDDDCDGNATCTGTLDWALSFGGAGADNSSAIASDASGNVIVAGNFPGTASFGGSPLTSAGANDVFVFKLDPAGKHIWSKSFGSPNGDNARGLAVDSAGNVVVVGGFSGPIDFGGGPLAPVNSSIFVAKLDPNGEHLWSKAFVGATTVNSTDATMDIDGNILISTTITGTVDFGGGPQTSGKESLAVIKLGPSGSYAWSKLFDSSFCCGAVRSAIAADATGNVGIAGSFQGQMAFGNMLVTSGNKDVFVAKLSSIGEPMWAIQGVGSGDEDVDGLAIDTTGAFIASGTLRSPSLMFGNISFAGYGNNDAFVVKVDSNGTAVWGRAFGLGGNVEVGSEVEVDAANNISFAGNTNSNMLDLGMGNVGPAGMFVVKLDPTGQTIWARMTDVATLPFPDAAIAMDNRGHTLLTRAFSAPMTFGGTALPSGGLTDIFVIKLGL